MAREQGNSGSVSWTSSSAETSSIAPTLYSSKSQGRRGCCYYVYSTIAGDAKIYYIDWDTDGTERLLHTQAIAATTLTLIDLDFPVPRSLVKFTPGTSSTGSARVEGFTY